MEEDSDGENKGKEVQRPAEDEPWNDTSEENADLQKDIRQRPA